MSVREKESLENKSVWQNFSTLDAVWYVANLYTGFFKIHKAGMPVFWIICFLEEKRRLIIVSLKKEFVYALSILAMFLCINFFHIYVHNFR